MRDSEMKKHCRSRREHIIYEKGRTFFTVFHAGTIAVLGGVAACPHG